MLWRLNKMAAARCIPFLCPLLPLLPSHWAQGHLEFRPFGGNNRQAGQLGAFHFHTHAAATTPSPWSSHSPWSSVQWRWQGVKTWCALLPFFHHCQMAQTLNSLKLDMVATVGCVCENRKCPTTTTTLHSAHLLAHLPIRLPALPSFRLPATRCLHIDLTMLSCLATTWQQWVGRSDLTLVTWLRWLRRIVLDPL